MIQGMVQAVRGNNLLLLKKNIHYLELVPNIFTLKILIKSSLFYHSKSFYTNLICKKFAIQNRDKSNCNLNINSFNLKLD